MSQILDSLTLKDTKTGKYTEYTLQDSTLKARVDNLVANAGNTGDNAELIDIRVGEDGTQYPTAGEAVRGQVSKLKDDLVNHKYTVTGRNITIYNANFIRIKSETTQNVVVSGSNIIGHTQNNIPWRNNGNSTNSVADGIVAFTPLAAAGGIFLSARAGDIPLIKARTDVEVSIAATIKGDTENIIYIGGATSDTRKKFNITTEWQRLRYSWILDDNGTQILKSGSDNLGEKIYVKDISIEVGASSPEFEEYHESILTVNSEWEKIEPEKVINITADQDVTVEYTTEKNIKWNGKIISILGDSISTFGGNAYDDPHYSEGIYTIAGNRCRYPYTNYLTDVNETYWMKLIDDLGLRLGISETWAGSKITWNNVNNLRDDNGTVYMAGPTRIGNLGDNGTPDIILVHAGTNDIAPYAGGYITLGEFNKTTPENYNKESVEALPHETIADGYKKMLLRLQSSYPNSKIVCLIPNIVYGYYPADKLNDVAEVIKQECDYYGAKYVDLRKCGITLFDASKYTPDTVHPNIEGMDLIYRYIKDALN